MKKDDLLLGINKAGEFFSYFGQFRDKGIFFTFSEEKLTAISESAEKQFPELKRYVHTSTIIKPEAEPEMALKFYKALWDKNKVVYNNREVDFANDQIKKIDAFDENLKNEYHEKFINFRTLLFTIIENGGSKPTETYIPFELPPSQKAVLKDVHKTLRDAGLIKCELPEFRIIFSGKSGTRIGPTNKVEWIGTANSLIYFVKGLYYKVMKVEKVDWKKAAHSFNFKGGNLADRDFRTNNKSQPKKEIKSQIDIALGHFLANSK